MAMLPKIDGALLVAAAGVTKVPEIQSCEGQISQLGKLLGIALNKSDVAPEEYSWVAKMVSQVQEPSAAQLWRGGRFSAAFAFDVATVYSRTWVATFAAVAVTSSRPG